MSGKVEHLNPPGLHTNPAFTQLVAVTGPAKTIYLGVQNAVDGPTLTIVGKGDIQAQTQQDSQNIDIALAAAGARREDIVTWTICLAAGQPMQKAMQAAMPWWGNRPNPPANSVLIVAGFPTPTFLWALTRLRSCRHKRKEPAAGGCS